MDVHDGVEAAFGEDVDQHRERQGILQHLVFGVYQGAAGNRVADDDRHDLLFDELHHPVEELGMLQFVAVQALDQLLAGVDDDLAGDRGCRAAGPPSADPAPGCVSWYSSSWTMFCSTSADRALGVDEVVVEDLLQFLAAHPQVCSLNTRQRPLRQRQVEIRGALLEGASSLPVRRTSSLCARISRPRAGAAARTLVSSSTKRTP